MVFNPCFRGGSVPFARTILCTVLLTHELQSELQTLWEKVLAHREAE